MGAPIFPMDPHEYFTQDHQAIREKVQALEQRLTGPADLLTQSLLDFQSLIRDHFKREDTYYRILDDGKRVEDRGLVHQLRNDHAAVIFTLESLAIRLRKNGVTDEWKQRFQNMINVLLPHLMQEESTLFPIGKRLLTAQETSKITEELSSRE